MNTVKVKTAELEGAQLDWAVLVALGYRRPAIIKGTAAWNGPMWIYENPSTNWAQGGHIIERERIGLYFYEHSSQWFAAVEGRPDRDGGCFDEKELSGITPLIAAMRAFVASKLGDEVEVPV